MSSQTTETGSPDTLLCVMVSAPTDTADRLACGIVEQRLAACVQVTLARSCYRWKDAIETAEESLLLIKTTQAAFSALERWVCQNHPYEVPEILALPVVNVHSPYGNWLYQNVNPA